MFVEDNEIEVQIAGPEGPIIGTLCGNELKYKKAIVIIVPGSGPTDRNGNNPLGVSAATYKLLSEYLYSQDILSIRYDKRGLFASNAAIPDANKVTIEDYATDLSKWVSWSRREFPESPIIVFGHSEGGLISLVAAASTPYIEGVVLAAAPGRPAGIVLYEQLRSQLPDVCQILAAKNTINNLCYGRLVDTSGLPQPLQPLFNKSIQPYLIDLFNYDPAEVISSVRQPILILQGLSDVQVTKTDALRLEAGNRATQLMLIPNMNHVLKRQIGAQKEDAIHSYSDPKNPIHKTVLRSVCSFISQFVVGAR